MVSICNFKLSTFFFLTPQVFGLLIELFPNWRMVIKQRLGERSGKRVPSPSSWVRVLNFASFSAKRALSCLRKVKDFSLLRDGHGT